MLIRTLKRLKDEELYGFESDIVDNIIDSYDDEEEIDYDTFLERLEEELGSYFTYYSDAFDFLQENNITDFNDAIQEWGATDVCAIACYYAREQVSESVYSCWEEYEFSEIVEDEEEEDSDIE